MKLLQKLISFSNNNLKWKLILLSTLLMNTVDAIFTIKLIGNAREFLEANPIMSYVLGISLPLFVFIKGILVPYFITIIYDNLEAKLSKVASVILFSSYMFVMYSWICILT